jgi:hypothetical protein
VRSVRGNWRGGVLPTGQPASAADRSGPERGERVLSDLAVLTPPLLVCVAFLIALALFLRHEMGRSRRRSDEDASGDISGNDTILHSAASRAAQREDDAGRSGTD